MIPIPAHVLTRFLTQAALIKVTLAKDLGLSAFQFLALTLVGGQAWLPLKELRNSLSVPGSTLTFTVDSLEKKGLVRRRQDKEDRRQWFLCLSSKGKRVYARMLKAESDLMAPALEGLSDTERAAFLRLARELSDATQAG